jgi:hypothetical protein
MQDREHDACQAAERRAAHPAVDRGAGMRLETPKCASVYIASSRSIAPTACRERDREAHPAVFAHRSEARIACALANYRKSGH